MPDNELQNLFDFLELKRGEKLGCSICGGNDWLYAGRVGVTAPTGGAVVGRGMVQLVCTDCKQVLHFTDEILDGP